MRLWSILMADTLEVETAETEEVVQIPSLDLSYTDWNIIGACIAYVNLHWDHFVENMVATGEFDELKSKLHQLSMRLELIRLIAKVEHVDNAISVALDKQAANR